LIIEDEWLEKVRAELPELPAERKQRYQRDYQLKAYDAGLLVNEQAVADYFEECVAAARKKGVFSIIFLNNNQLDNWRVVRAAE
jgi:Asp-tRNA(Asn)/Glu-tRNA(Gln) amidotransferase B subunit